MGRVGNSLPGRGTAGQRQKRERAAGRDMRPTFITHSSKLGDARDPAVSQTRPACPLVWWERTKTQKVTALWAQQMRERKVDLIFIGAPELSPSEKAREKFLQIIAQNSTAKRSAVA